METIEEQSKNEEMSVSPTPSPDNLRICLVGTVAEDTKTFEAAQSFGIPVITSENPVELISDVGWTTYFILHDFEGPAFEAIHKSKHRIMGPPALQQAVQMKEGLLHGNRPIYNYSMRGVITCFTGIRKKDELTRLVNLIHSMGGSIRKDMNSKVTHLICNTSGGEKYQYAMTFRLAVVRSQWVYDAWNKRDQPEFKATCEEFTKSHRLKAFEGQKICFFGFANDEREHMIDVLKNNGGIPADLEDPDCSHVVMANTGGHFPDNIPVSPNSTSPEPLQFVKSPSNKNEANLLDIDQNSNESEDNHPLKLSKIEQKEDVKNIPTTDGIVLSSKEENAFINPNNISPILKTQKSTDISITSNQEEHEIMISDLYMKDLKRKRDSLDCNASLLSNDSSIYYVNNVVEGSAKKPKLARTGSITRSLRRSMSFAAIKTPISNILRSRRNSIDPNTSITSIASIDTTLNESTSKRPVKEKLKNLRDRITRSNKTVVTPKSIKSNKLSTSSSTATLKRISEIRDSLESEDSTCHKTPIKNNTNKEINVKQDCVDFKTPIAPKPSTPSSFALLSSSPFSYQTTISYRHSICGVGSTNTQNLNDDDDNITNCFVEISTPPPSSVKESFLTSIQENNDEKYCKIQVEQVEKEDAQEEQSFTKIKNTKNTNDDSIIVTQSSTINTIMSSARSSSSSSTSSTYTSSSSSSSVNTNVLVTSNVLTATASSTVHFSSRINFDAPVTFNDDNVTMVVDEHFTQAKPEPKNNKTHIVKSDWFWYTIQNGYADETDYLFGDYLDSIANTPVSDRRDSLPISFNKRKRKRFSQRLQSESGTPLGSVGKRRSSVSDAGLLSMSGSFLDCTQSPDKHDTAANNKLKSSDTSESSSINDQHQTSSKNKSMRYNHFMDLYNTESNYVGILDTIVNLFKIPLEEKADTDDALLNKSEVRAIFNNFLPIHEVHRKMLERLRELQTKWYEDCLIGQIILEHRDDLIKAYPPYVNFFEQMKETLIQCDKENPRFHAFLKINQAKPECGRQTLQDLMIRPVQRLPSISLLLNDILKHTHKNNADHKKLDEALRAIKDVMAHINEDKRKTEGQKAMFDIFNDIEGCPAHLVSSHRSFVSKCEVTELSDCLSGRGDSLTLYLFTDTIEVCKKRSSRGFNSGKSPSTTKSYKHIKLMPLSSIRFVIDICDSPRAFALNYRHSQDNKDKLCSFVISDDEIDKVIYIRSLCKQMAENACRTDTDKPLLSMTSQELDVDITDVNLSTLSKAFKFATRTRLKVGRAFSFNKTPSKLKRAMSTMMASPFGSTNSLTPASQLAQMRLASCTNINEMGNEEDNQIQSPPSSQESDNNVLIAPMSVQPTRKAKISTISMAALRRL